MERKYKRLPLEGLGNARDLGGFAASGGKITKYGVFVRSELPAHLTRGDIEFLRNYGVTMSMDLRGTEEIERAPSMLSRQSEWLRYVPRPLFNESAASYAKGYLKADRSFEWLPEYISMAENGKLWVKRNFELCADWDGCILYHCHTGKDRTGIFTAMLLGVCGVSDEDIAWDYGISMVLLAPVYEEMAAGGQFADKDGKTDFRSGFFLTSPDTMLGFMKYMRDTYGGMRQFVLSCGVSEETIDRVVDKLTE